MHQYQRCPQSWRCGSSRDVHGGSGSLFFMTVAARQFIFYYRRGAAPAVVQPRWTSLGNSRFVLENNAKMHEAEQKCNVRKCETMRLNESYRLVTTIVGAAR
jgi:hypothetical protein